MKTMIGGVAFASLLLLATPVLADGWNAVAVDRHTGAVGFAIDRESKASAESKAKEECLKDADTCGAVHAQQGGCVAVSRNQDGSRFGVAMEADIQKTVVEALNECSDGGKHWGCTVHTNTCAPRSS